MQNVAGTFRRNTVNHRSRNWVGSTQNTTLGLFDETFVLNTATQLQLVTFIVAWEWWKRHYTSKTIRVQAYSKNLDQTVSRKHEAFMIWSDTFPHIMRCLYVFSRKVKKLQQMSAKTLSTAQYFGIMKWLIFDLHNSTAVLRCTYLSFPKL